MYCPLGECRDTQWAVFSVCGLFCGQSQKQKAKTLENVLKIKENPVLSAEKTGFFGAAIQI